MEDCVFCKIVSGVFSSNTVYEDDDFKAIMDIMPSAVGHIIIVAKKHAANIFEMEDDVLAKGMIVAKKVAKAVKEATGCDGVNILQNNGVAAGQTVFHFHIHIIPRFDNDDISISWKQLSPSDDELKAMCQKIKDNMLA